MVEELHGVYQKLYFCKTCREFGDGMIVEMCNLIKDMKNEDEVKAALLEFNAKNMFRVSPEENLEFQKYVAGSRVRNKFRK